MRKILFSIVILALGFFAGCALTSGRPRQISGPEFQKELVSINSAYSSRLIGATGDRVYLERKSLVELPAMLGFGPTVVVYYANLSEFTAEDRSVLEQGKLPWK